MNRLVFGMHDLNISQVGTLIDGRPHYSHPNFALDLTGSDAGIDYWKNKEADVCFYCAGAFGTKKTGNTRFFVSCDAAGKQMPVRCADGKARVVTLAMTHSGRDYRLYHIYTPGEIMYQEGTAGRATGNHVHMEVAEGSVRTKYWDAKLKVWRMKGEFNPVDAFFVLEPYTKVIDTKGLKFKTTQTVREDTPMGTDAEKLVAYAETQIGNTGASYWQYFGYQDAWCSEFVSYCGYKCGFVPARMPKADTCAKAIDFYKARNQLHSKADYTPKTGDIVFFGDKGTDHTAIVKKVSSENLVVIEGNAGDKDFRKSRVCETVYSRASKWVWGFANPLTQQSPKRMDITDAIKKTGGDFVIGGIAGTNGTEFKVPKGASIELHTVHNSTASLNSVWHITMTSRRAFKLSSGTPTVSVKVTDEDKIVVQSQAGSPRTYWKLLE